MKIISGDTVRVIAGKDKGKEGKVLKVFTSNNKVLVEGINLIKKHVKKDVSETGITEIAKPVDASNVAVLSGGKSARVGYEIKAGKKVRIFKVGKQTGAAKASPKTTKKTK